MDLDRMYARADELEEQRASYGRAIAALERTMPGHPDLGHLEDELHTLSVRAERLEWEIQREECKRGWCDHYTCTEGEALREWEVSHGHDK